MDYSLFSADDHVDLHYLPADLWHDRVPKRYQERCPHLVDNGTTREWRANGLTFGRRLPPSDDKLYSTFGAYSTPVMHEQGRWRPTTPDLRLADMDRDHVQGHVLYGTVPGFNIDDPELNVVWIRAYNDWIAEFCSYDSDRLIGLGFLPVNNVEVATAELLRCAKIGLKGVQFPAFSAFKYPQDSAWEPLWSAANETRIPISFHIASGTWSCNFSLPAERISGRGDAATFLVTGPNQLDEILCSLIFCGALKRYPRFRVVLAECGIGWIPYILERMDRKFEEKQRSKKQDDAAELDMLPSEYYKAQMHATFEEDPVGIRLLDLIGENTIMWASDYPHPDSVWPNSHTVVDEMFKDVDPTVKRKIVRENAMNLYGVGL